jgi:bacterioferritin-associated ferredoxin
LTDAEKLGEVLRVVEGVEHGLLVAGRLNHAHLQELRRILDAPGAGDGCASCVDAAERAAQAEDRAAASLARLGLDQPLDDPWGA